MKDSITDLAVTFINNMIRILTVGETINDFEVEALREAKDYAAKMITLRIESVDAAIVSDKAARRESGYAIERRNDERSFQSLVGEISYSRTYYAKASGGYEYLADTALGITERSRVSENLSLSLVKASKDMSYWKASNHIADGAISKQTVMGRVRQSCAVENPLEERRRVPELHIDADEAHITLTGGKKSEVPLISVYEGIETNGKRNSCKKIFHISEYGKTPDRLWEQALTEIERRYDLTDTRIYLHGDGAKWIKTCFDWIPQAIFVLDKYHKNKAIKNMTAGLKKEVRKQFDTAIRESLSEENLQLFRELTKALCAEMPDRYDKIRDSAKYLKKFVSGISICAKDSGANNGGCTEPHVSHILSARLSTRPMAWSKQTLIQLAPILATKNVAIQGSQLTRPQLPKPLIKTAAQANKKFFKSVKNWSTGLPHPDAIGTLPIVGKRTGTQVLLKLYA